MPRYARAVLGGTFDRLHVGHEALLGTAFRAGRSVGIGLTTARFLRQHPKPDGQRIQPYATRRRALVRWLSTRYPRARWQVVPLDDPFGGSVEEGVGVLVVSADTTSGARAVNAERRRRGRPTVPCLVVPLVLADDLVPVSSRRIRAGEIDRSGRRVGPISVGLRVSEPDDLAPANRALRRTFPRARIRAATGSSLTGPPSDEALRRAAAAAVRGRELAVAVSAPRRGRRRVIVRSAGVQLQPTSVADAPPGKLSAALERLLRRSAAAKPFSPGPR